MIILNLKPVRSEASRCGCISTESTRIRLMLWFLRKFPWRIPMCQTSLRSISRLTRIKPLTVSCQWCIKGQCVYSPNQRDLYIVCFGPARLHLDILFFYFHKYGEMISNLFKSKLTLHLVEAATMYLNQFQADQSRSSFVYCKFKRNGFLNGFV